MSGRPGRQGAACMIDHSAGVPVEASPASSRGGAATATTRGHPMRLAYASDARSAWEDPDSGWSHPCSVRRPAVVNGGIWRGHGFGIGSWSWARQARPGHRQPRARPGCCRVAAGRGLSLELQTTPLCASCVRRRHPVAHSASTRWISAGCVQNRSPERLGQAGVLRACPLCSGTCFVGRQRRLRARLWQSLPPDGSASTPRPAPG